MSLEESQLRPSAADGYRVIHAGERAHVHAELYIPNLDADLAQADRRLAQSLPARATLYAGPRPQVAREAFPIAPLTAVLVCPTLQVRLPTAYRHAESTAAPLVPGGRLDRSAAICGTSAP
jgi:hypothetical protein